MDDLESLNVPMPGSGRMPDFAQPIQIQEDGLHTAALYFSWQQQTVGYGQCSVSLDDNGNVTADTEGMGKEWLRRALYAAADAIVEKAKLV